ncbi:OmpA family protein [Serratia marcescens]|uniref:OmpA family protein n=1 Tax=Serratia marcescens TaxID=615 RepID=A0A5C7C1H7_SERMA|nr:OmpA family protein [Serratia marcescens]TXE26755.1 OmpA family protein [Serratia marcescens]TXE55020.1 OmpA family protein [Serratia marcescens]
MRASPRHTLMLLTLILSLWLVNGFWAVSLSTQLLLSLLVLLTAGGLLWNQWQHRPSAGQAHGRLADDVLPPDTFTGAVILVAGDSVSLFLPEQRFRETSQGWYLRTDTPEQLPRLAEQLAHTRPALLPRVAVLLAVAPEQHTREETFQQTLRSWQRAIIQCHEWLSGPPALLSAVWLSPPDEPALSDARWFTVTPGHAELRVHLPGEGVLTLSDWQREAAPAVRLSRLSQSLWLDNLQAWYQHVVMPALQTVTVGQNSLRPAALGYCLTPVRAEHDNLWQHHTAAQTTMIPAAIPEASLLPLPDVLLSSLSRHRGVSRRMQFWRTAGLISSVFLLLAMTCSFVNNQRLIRTLSDHLTLYARLGEQPAGLRLQAQATLRTDLQQLNDQQRRGVPQRYGLGLYQGMRLIAPVNAAVNGWTPEVSTVKQPVVKATPSTVRLDSLSLFDTGSATLKSGSTSVLVNALMGIKAKPGWLIVVSGHTDNTGSAQLNQTLSLKRADAVRNWMRDTGGVPESCFAVQGYGATRPLQTNDTTAGRAANRRVEIRLVPQADACRIPGTHSVSPRSGGAS